MARFEPGVRRIAVAGSRQLVTYIHVYIEIASFLHALMVIFLSCTLPSTGPSSTDLAVKEEKAAKQAMHRASSAHRRLQDPTDFLVRMPAAWFMDPLRAAILKRVRPCTARTRRKQLEIKNIPMPRRVFEEFMKPLEETDFSPHPGELHSPLQRNEMGELIPTRSSAKAFTFEYVIRRGSVTDKLVRLQDAFSPPPASKQKRKGRFPDRWQRAHGCAKLHLSGAAGRRGNLGTVMAMVAGNVLIRYQEPKFLKAMPRLTLKFFVLSMDLKGHILWPTNFAPKSKAALRRQARHHLLALLKNPNCPVDPRMEEALSEESGALLPLSLGWKRIPVTKARVKTPPSAQSA